MNKLLTSVLCSLVGFNAVLAADPSRPKLVVGIMVDQLRTDYIEDLQGLFGDGGFKRLMKDGVFLKNLDFHVPELDKASATAMVYTGAYPRHTGVPSAKIYDSKTNSLVDALLDPATLGNFTTETYSPANLRLSTLSDEVAIDGAGVAAVHALAPDPQQAIAMGGHAGTSAFWIDDNTGRWATTTFYRDAPKTLSTRNYSNPLPARMDTMQWKPLLPLDRYPGLPAQKRMFDFKHTFSMSDRDVFRNFLSTPMANAEVTDVALEYIQDLNMGNRGDAMDMLNVAYTLAPYKEVKDGDFRLELADSYVRLDRQLSRLFDAIDKSVGLDNAVVFLSSTGYYDDAAPEDPRYNIPTGEFSVKRGLSLLNSFLSAKFGNGNYVDTYRNGHIYLDRAEIEAHNLLLNDVAREARDFMVRMSGVTDAFTMGDILTSALPSMEARRLGTDPKTGGDVVLTFSPGWKVVNDTKFPNTVKVMRNSMTLTPAFIMAPGVLAHKVDTPVDATALAPTVARVLRIRSPNGAETKPLPLLLK